MRKVVLLECAGIAVACLLLLYPRSTEAGTNANIGQKQPSALPVYAFRPSEGVTLTHPIYVPFVRTDLLPITETLKTRYLLVEYWTDRESGGDCGPSICIDFPGYSFYPPTGELALYFGNSELSADDAGYIGSGISLRGTNCGASSQLATFEELPFSTELFYMGSMTLHSVDGTGAISMVRDGETIDLKSQARWISSTVAAQETAWGVCTVTTTQHVANYGFQHRGKID